MGTAGTKEGTSLTCYYYCFFSIRTVQANVSHCFQTDVTQSEQVKGETVETFIAAAQDRTRNALNNSLLAAFNAWQEQLKGDQVSFESQKILPLNRILNFEHILACCGIIRLRIARKFDVITLCSRAPC